MSNNTNYIIDEHQDHIQWIKDLEFYEEDLAFLTSQLEDVSSKNTGSDLKKKVEKFQNQFIIQQNEIDILKHNINKNEEILENKVIENPVAIEHRKMEDDLSLRDRVETFARLFKEMKAEFNSFLAANL